MALMHRQVPWVGFVAVAMTAALLTSILVLNFGGSSVARLSPAKVQAVAPGGQHKRKDLPRNSRETLEVAQKTCVSVEGAAQKQVGCVGDTCPAWRPWYPRCTLTEVVKLCSVLGSAAETKCRQCNSGCHWV